MFRRLANRHPEIRHKLLSPFVMDVDPDKITFAAFFCAVLSGYFYYSGAFLAAAAFLALNGFLDLLDGEIAKKGTPTKKGDFLDHTFDRASDIAIFLGVSYNPAVPTDLGLVALVFTLLVSYMGTQAHALTKARIYGGVLGRADRHALLFAGTLASFLIPSAFVLSLYVIICLSVVTFFQRFHIIYRILEK